MVREAQIHQLTVFADNFQFYIQDEKTGYDYPENCNAEISTKLFVEGPNLLGIGTVRDLDVDVTIEIYNSGLSESEIEEEIDLSEWDHAVQCNIDIPSGKILVVGCTENIDEAAKIELAPGHYGVRIFWGKLSSLDDLGFEGDDTYKIMMWPDTSFETEVMKFWRSFIYQLGEVQES